MLFPSQDEGPPPPSLLEIPKLHGQPLIELLKPSPSSSTHSLSLLRPSTWLERPIEPRGWMAICMAASATFMQGGVVFGLAALYPLLFRRELWSSVCGESAAVRCHAEATEARCCNDQFVQFSLLTSVAFFVSDAAAAPWGEIVDRIGGRSSLAISCSMFCVGFVGLGVGVLDNSELLTGTSVLLLALAGPGVCDSCYIGCLQLLRRAVAPAHRASLTAALTAFVAAVINGSALVLPMLERAATRGPTELLCGTVLWATLCIVTSATLWHLFLPDEEPLSPPRTLAPLTEPLMVSDGSCDGSFISHCSPARSSARSSAESFASPLLVRQRTPVRLRKTLGQTSNLLLVFLMTVLNLTCNFFIQTQSDQVSRPGGWGVGSQAGWVGRGVAGRACRHWRGGRALGGRGRVARTR